MYPRPVIPSSVSTSTSSSGAVRTVAALVPSTKRIGTSTAVQVTPRRRGASVLASASATTISRGIQRQDVRDGAVAGRRHAFGPAQIDYAAGKPAHLQRIAALQV